MFVHLCRQICQHNTLNDKEPWVVTSANSYGEVDHSFYTIKIHMVESEWVSKGHLELSRGCICALKYPDFGILGGLSANCRKAKILVSGIPLHPIKHKSGA